VTFIEQLAKSFELLEFELGDHDVLPGRARADERGVHELEHRPLAKGVRNDLGTPARLAEEPLEHVRRARRAPVRNRQLQVRDTGVEVIEKAARRARVVIPLQISSKSRSSPFQAVRRVEKTKRQGIAPLKLT
jgi:hypothetical protein